MNSVQHIDEPSDEQIANSPKPILALTANEHETMLVGHSFPLIPTVGHFLVSNN
jgi:hypothetical protein